MKQITEFIFFTTIVFIAELIIVFAILFNLIKFDAYINKTNELLVEAKPKIEEVKIIKKEEPKVEPITDTPVDLNIDLTLPTDVENKGSLNAETKDEEPKSCKDQTNSDLSKNLSHVVFSHRNPV